MKFKTLLLSALLPAACVAPRSGRHEGCEDRERGGQPHSHEGHNHEGHNHAH